MSTRKITDGAMFAAMIGVLLLADRQFAGFFDFTIFWIASIPIIVYIAKYRLQDAGALLVTVMAIAMMLSPIQTVFYVVMACLAAFLYGWGIKKKYPNHILLGISIAVSLVSSFLSMLVFASLFGFDMYRDALVTIETMTQFAELIHFPIPDVTRFISVIVIFGLVLMGVMEGIVIHLMSYLVLTRLKLTIAPMKPLSQIQLSRKAGIMLLLFVCAVAVSQMMIQSEYLINILYFMLFAALFLFVANGYLSLLTILAYYNKRKSAFLYLLISMVFLLPIGIADSIWNLRERLTIKVSRQSERRV